MRADRSFLDVARREWRERRVPVVHLPSVRDLPASMWPAANGGSDCTHGSPVIVALGAAVSSGPCSTVLACRYSCCSRTISAMRRQGFERCQALVPSPELSNQRTIRLHTRQNITVGSLRVGDLQSTGPGAGQAPRGAHVIVERVGICCPSPSRLERSHHFPLLR